MSHRTPLEASVQYLFSFGAQLFAFPCPLSPSIAQKSSAENPLDCIAGFHERLCILLSLCLDWWRMIRESSIHCTGYCVTCFGGQYLWVFEQSTIQVFAPSSFINRFTICFYSGKTFRIGMKHQRNDVCTAKEESPTCQICVPYGTPIATTHLCAGSLMYRRKTSSKRLWCPSRRTNGHKSSRRS